MKFYIIISTTNWIVLRMMMIVIMLITHSRTHARTHARTHVLLPLLPLLTSTTYTTTTTTATTMSILSSLVSYVIHTMLYFCFWHKVLAEKIGYPGARAGRTMAEKCRVVNDAVMSNVSHDRTVIEFSRDRKSMSVLCGSELFVKGAPEGLLDRCDSVLLSTGQIVPLDRAMRTKLNAELELFAKRALRVLALAYADHKDASRYDLDDASHVREFESDLTFCGFAAMIDPPRAEVKDSVMTCKRAGIRVIVITGDNKLTAESICRSIGVFGPRDNLAGRSYTHTHSRIGLHAPCAHAHMRTTNRHAHVCMHMFACTCLHACICTELRTTQRARQVRGAGVRSHAEGTACPSREQCEPLRPCRAGTQAGACLLLRLL